MTGRGWFRVAILILMMSGTSLMLMAQAANSSSEKKPETLKGLDDRFIDKSADPCVDFFKYACGKFTKYYPIPEDHSSYGIFALVSDRNEAILHSILEKAAAGGVDRTPNEQKVGDYYSSCMDVDAINKKGLEPLQADLDRIAALKDKSELTPLLAHFQLINANAFLGFGEQQDFKDATKQIALVDQGGFGLPERDYYFRTGEAAEKTRKEYVQHITNMLKLMGEPESEAASDAQSIMQLETALAKVSMDITTQRDPNKVYHMMPVSELEKLTPNIDWPKFFVEGGAPAVTQVNVTNPDFFKRLSALLDTTDLSTIKAYLRWQLIDSVPSIALPQAFDEEDFNFFGRESARTAGTARTLEALRASHRWSVGRGSGASVCGQGILALE